MTAGPTSDVNLQTNVDPVFELTAGTVSEPITETTKEISIGPIPGTFPTVKYSSDPNLCLPPPPPPPPSPKH